MKSLVSCIIPTYNLGIWVCEAVDSCLQQVYGRLEVIVVDDGSTDNTRELLQHRYGDSIKYIYQQNRGLAGARNTGIRQAKGDYLQFLDADDTITTDKIERQVKTLEEHKEYSVAYSDFEYFEDGTTITNLSPAIFREKYQTGNPRKSFLTGNFIVCHAALARKAEVVAAGCFDESLRACEDFDLWMRMAARGSKFIYTDGVMARYRRTPGSMSSLRANQFKWTIDVVMKNVGKFGLNDSGERNSARNYISSLHAELGRFYRSEGRLIKAIMHSFLAVRFAPGESRTIAKGLFHK